MALKPPALQPVSMPRNVVRALVAFELRKLEPWPEQWRPLDADAEGREGVALHDGRGLLLAEYWLAYGGARAQLRVRAARPRVLVELELAGATA